MENTERFIQESVTFPTAIQEHMDYAIGIESNPVQFMKDPTITHEEVENQMKLMKVGKAAGPDGIKSKLYKITVDDKEIIGKITLFLNDTLTSGI